jgi:hypothetical protein
MRKTNLNPLGVTGYLMLNGQTIDQATIVGQDGVGVKRVLVMDVQSNDLVDLALGPAGECGDRSDGSDGSLFFLTVREAPAGATPGAAQIIADSMRDHSGNQGDGGWSYGYYDQRADVELGNGVYDASDFIAFLNDGSGVVSATNQWHSAGNKWDLLDQGIAGQAFGPWTEITCSGGHPAGNGLPDHSVHWAIRRWTSDQSGVIELSATAFNAGAGDGMVARIFLNGSPIYSGLTDGIPLRIRMVLTVATGDVIDFCIDPDGAGNLAVGGLNTVNDGADGSLFPITIRQTVGTPAVETDCQDGIDNDGDLATDCADSDCESAPNCQGVQFRRGDSNADGQINITDGIYVLNYLFLGGPTPTCIEAANPNDDPQVNITDGIYILNFLFLGGPPPAAPGQESCGKDPAGSPNDLGCSAYDRC